MDIVIHANRVVNQFYKYGGYTDLTEEELKHAVVNYLEKEYRKEMAMALIKVSRYFSNSSLENDEAYKKEYRKIEEKITQRADELAAYQKHHVL